jgi:hypothetical protein
VLGLLKHNDDDGQPLERRKATMELLRPNLLRPARVNAPSALPPVKQLLKQREDVGLLQRKLGRIACKMSLIEAWNKLVHAFSTDNSASSLLHELHGRWHWLNRLLLNVVPKHRLHHPLSLEWQENFRQIAVRVAFENHTWPFDVLKIVLPTREVYE